MGDDDDDDDDHDDDDGYYEKNTRYFSDPANNYGEGSGDINEILQRQRWKKIGLWVSNGNINNNDENNNYNPLEFGKVSWTTRSSGIGEFIRHEWFYMGTR